MIEKVYYNLQSCDFDKIGWVWDLYKGHKMVIKCKECGKLVKRRSKFANPIYCVKCANETKKAQDKVADAKYKAKKREKP